MTTVQRFEQIPKAEGSAGRQELEKGNRTHVEYFINEVEVGCQEIIYSNLASLGEYHDYALCVLFQTEDHKEGATTFVEKMEPVSRGV